MPLDRLAGGASCPRGHRFDAARSGYLNLLQPQDRRSRAPGDTQSAIEGRRLLFASGILEPLYAPLRRFAASGAVVLDAGCGEGSFAGSLVGEGRTVVGADLSSVAVDLAARAFPSPTWIVANLDRGVPLLDGCVDVIFSIAARRNPAEFRRVLNAQGIAVVAVPAPADLVELREALGGRRSEESRVPVVEHEFADGWRIASVSTISSRRELEGELLRAAAAASYRGQRRSAAGSLDELDKLEVTFAFDVIQLSLLEK